MAPQALHVTERERGGGAVPTLSRPPTFGPWELRRVIEGPQRTRTGPDACRPCRTSHLEAALRLHASVLWPGASRSFQGIDRLP